MPGHRGGQPGNSNALRARPFWAAVNRAIVQEDGRRLREAAEHLLTQAAAGEPWALQMLADRLDGRPAQQVTISGDPDAPLVAASMSDEQLAAIAARAAKS